MRPTKKQIDIYDLLERIKQQPNNYLHSPTLVSLGDFLMGFMIAQHGPQIRRDGEPPFGDFTTWFGLHHQDRHGGWYGAIKAESSDGKHAFRRFFEHLDVYRQRKLKIKYRFALKPAQRKLFTKLKNSPAPAQLKVTQYKGEKCVFVHAIYRGPRTHYQFHAGFLSMAEARHSLAKYHGIRKSHWNKVKNEVTDKHLD